MTPRLSPDLNLNLPACPESLPPPTLLSSEDYFALLAEQIAWLHSTGELERILAQPDRQTADVPFRID